MLFRLFSIQFFSIFLIATFYASKSQAVPLPVAADALTCQLPAPASVFQIGATSNSITFGWTPVAGAVEYNVEFLDLTTNTPLGGIATDALFAIVNNVPAGHVVQCGVQASSCIGGPYGPMSYGLGSPILVIDDMVVQLSGGESKLTSGQIYQVYSTFENGSSGTISSRSIRVEGPNASWSAVIATIMFNGSNTFLFDLVSSTNGTYITSIEEDPSEGKYIKVQRKLGNNPATPVFKIKNISAGISQSFPVGYFVELYPSVAAVISHHPSTLCSEYYGGCGNYKPSPGTHVLGANFDEGQASDRAAEGAFSVVPNPFEDRVLARFDLTEAGTASLWMTDVAGRRVAELAPQTLPAGEHSLPIETSDLPVGLYWITLQTGPDRQTQALLKKQ